MATVLARTLAPVLGGLALGGAVSAATGRLLEAFLFGVPPTDPGTLLPVIAAFLAASLAAATIPAARVGRARPVEILRS